MPVQKPEKIRATQTLVSHMSFVWRHPSLTAIEVGWRWLFGLPFLWLVWREVQRILVEIPPESVGLDRLNFQNPWVSSVLLADAVGSYEPAVIAVLRGWLPVAVIVWAIVSGVGRTLVFWRMERVDSADSRVRLATLVRRLPLMIVLQGAWMLGLLAWFWLWYRAMGWVAATHFASAAEPDLLGYLCWLIFLSLGLFTSWAMLSWTLAIAPVRLLLRGDSPAQKSKAGLPRGLAGKLVEVNLVMAIVKIALIVLAMVFSAAPLPFSDGFGPDFMHVLYVLIAVGFLIGNDYFCVVRLRSYVALWRHYITTA